MCAPVPIHGYKKSQVGPKRIGSEVHYVEVVESSRSESIEDGTVDARGPVRSFRGVVRELGESVGTLRLEEGRIKVPPRGEGCTQGGAVSGICVKVAADDDRALSQGRCYGEDILEE